MHRVKSSGLFFRQAHRFNRHDFESRLLNPPKYFTLLPFTDCVRLNNRKCTFQCHEIPPGTNLDFAVYLYFSAAATVEPRSAGVSTQRIPAALIAAYLSFAVPCPPLIIAPAWPMRLPGGAGCPAINPTTGFFTLVLIHCAARSSASPPISPIMIMACVSASSLKSRIASKNVVPIIGSPPMPMHVDCPIPNRVNWSTASYVNVPLRLTTPTCPCWWMRPGIIPILH